MRLYVMRHGPAEDRAASGRDADRALSEEGRARVHRVTAELQRVFRSTLGGFAAPPDPATAPNPGEQQDGQAPGSAGPAGPRVLTSPLRRAVETAEIVARGLHGEELDIEIREELAFGAGTPLSLVAEVSARREDVLLVGHQPHVEDLVRTLLSQGDRRAGPLHRTPPSLASGFCTAMVVGLEMHPAESRWEVQVVVDPRRLG